MPVLMTKKIFIALLIKEFLNSKFVKDFYNIIKEDYIERYNEFLIDSEILSVHSTILLKKVIKKHLEVVDIIYRFEVI